MSLAKSIDALKASLADVEQQLPVLDNTHESLASAKASLAGVLDQKTQAERDLRKAQADADRAATAASEKSAAAEAEAAGRLKALQSQIAATKTALDELTVTHTSKLAEHNTVLASIESLRKRLGV